MQPSQRLFWTIFKVWHLVQKKDRLGVVQFCLNIWIVMAHIMLHVEKALNVVQGQTLSVNNLFQAYLEQFSFKILL